MNTLDSASERPGTAQAKAILSRPVDVLTSGGLSILVLLPILIFKGEWLDRLLPTHVLLLTVLINTPHFAASYWLVYRSPELIRRHPWAAVRVPALVLGLCLLALAVRSDFHAGVSAIVLASTVYLAWHYTGQAWGMIATFATLEGAPFDPGERGLLRGSIRILLAWHAVWALRVQSYFPEMADWLKGFSGPASGLLYLAGIVGAAGFLRWSLRLRRVPPVRVLVPWLAILVWYVAMALHPTALQLVQIGHALQYLPFPMRVEMNREIAKPIVAPAKVLWLGALALTASASILYFVPQLGHGTGPSWEMSPGVAAVTALSFVLLLLAIVSVRWPRPWFRDPRTLLWGIAMLQVGILWFGLAPLLLKRAAPVLPGGAPTARDAANLLIAFLNIHHYFTDGCAWKISTVEVRRELFAHLASQTSKAIGVRRESA